MKQETGDAELAVREERKPQRAAAPQAVVATSGENAPEPGSPRLTLQRVSVDYPIDGRPGVRLGGNAKQSVGGSIIEIGPRRFVRALDHVNVDFGNGARVGLLGGNGSGKSTLLRTLAGILPVAHGKRIIEGRLATLFSSTVGVDSERTGAENIHRMAALYGIPRAKVPALIEEIGAFTELGEFLYLPVKSYSAGMSSRLGFGFVTSVDADIILVDEVIGTGDKSFHAKARERLETFLSSRGIVVIASHSSPVLSSLCDTGIVLRKGSIAFSGAIGDAVDFYEETKRPNKK